jgi:2-oxoglutarate ferredoxin oxidoreductase subunit alpha
MAFEACRLAINHMTPVILLTDGYIANGAEPWKFPKSSDLPEIKVKYAEAVEGEKFLPYKRNQDLVRPWAIPGTKGLEHRVGGIEKEHETGNISYDPENHEFMVKTRQQKINNIANHIPDQQFDQGNENSKILVLGWGSTFGSIKAAVKELRADGNDVAHVHVRYLNPFPKNLGAILNKFDKIIIPELNNGQLVKIIRDRYLVNAQPFNKIKGLPFTSSEIKNEIIKQLK